MNEKRKGKTKENENDERARKVYYGQTKGRLMGPRQTNGSTACSLGLPLFKGKCNRHMQNCAFFV